MTQTLALDQWDSWFDFDDTYEIVSDHDTEPSDSSQDSQSESDNDIM